MLKRTEELKNFLMEVQDCVVSYPELYSLNSTDPIYLHTDACDTCMGSYLFVVVDAVERSIQFMRKGFNRSQLRWSTREKDCFVIYYA